MAKKKAAQSGKRGAASTTTRGNGRTCLGCGKPATPNLWGAYVSRRPTPEGKCRVIGYPICFACWLHCRNCTKHAKRHLQPRIESALEPLGDVAIFPVGASHD